MYQVRPLGRPGHQGCNRRVMARNFLVVWIGLTTACLQPAAVVQCDDGRICPGGYVCIDAVSACVPAAHAALCTDKADRAPCILPDNVLGACHGGGCFEAVCGNGLEDLPPNVECPPELGAPCPIETCDDGNNIDGDGCASNCRSSETCSNSIIDIAQGESCDDGNLLDHDGCSSSCRTEEMRWVQAYAPGPLSQARAAYDPARGKVVIVGGRVPGATAPNDVPTNGVSEYGDGVWHRFIETSVVAPNAQPIALRVTNPNPGFALAYDVGRRLTVMAGGKSVGSVREVWGWDGNGWHTLPALPIPLEGAAMAYDAKRGRLVVFGGRTNGTGSDVVSDDTYELAADDTQWTKVAPAARPTPRAEGTMAYDPKRGVLVLAGGDANGSEIWEYDGATWVKKVASGGSFLPERRGLGMAYDRKAGRMVILDDADTNGAKLFFWDGTVVTPYLGAMPMATPATVGAVPTAVRYAAAFVETDDSRLMLYGGETRFGSNDSYLLTSRLQWWFENDTWTEPATPPPAIGACYATLQDQGQVVRFGGNGSTGTTPAINETWELGRRGWIKSNAGPVALEFCAMAYDAGRDRLVLFGGETNNGSVQTATRETWTRTQANWAQHPPTADWPDARILHGLAYDAARGETVLFGGRTAASGTRLADTWVWNGTTWLRRTPSMSPTARSSMAMAYDPIGRVVVMFGGSPGQNQSTNETWIWDGTTWTNLTPLLDELPAAVDLQNLTWNPARRSLVLTFEVSFTAMISDTWEWTMTSASPYRGQWRRVHTTLEPPSRLFQGAYASLDGSGITVASGFNNVPLDDLWELRSDASGFETCRNALDGDADGLVMCADPDCWRFCTPECPPGTSCSAQTGSRCGDGTCSAIEDCRSCPGDCVTCTDTRCGDFACDPGETCPGDCP